MYSSVIYWAYIHVLYRTLPYAQCLAAARCLAAASPQCEAESLFIEVNSVELWLDKERIKAGDDWSRELATTQRHAMRTLIFLSNAYCGSANCVEELEFASRENLNRTPIYLETLAEDEQDFSEKQIAELCDSDMTAFHGFQSSVDNVKKLTGRLHSEMVKTDLSYFICDGCRSTRRCDFVCPYCSDWETVVRGPAAQSMKEVVASLGRQIDTIAMQEPTITVACD